MNVQRESGTRDAAVVRKELALFDSASAEVLALAESRA